MKYVAVVCKKDISFSSRENGDYASFIGDDKDDVIARAMKANQKWACSNLNYGPYTILVGTLTEEVITPKNFKLAKLKQKKEPAVTVRRRRKKKNA